MAEIVEFLTGDTLQIGVVTAADKKLTVGVERGRPLKVAPEKVLFRHAGASLEAVVAELDELAAELDVEFLWEALASEGQTEAQEARELAELFFDERSDAHASAVFRALTAERLHFRRRGLRFEPRSAEDIAQVREQREAEARAAAEHEALVAALRNNNARQLEDDFAERLERHVRGRSNDKPLAAALDEVARDGKRYAFNMLVNAGRLPTWADLEAVSANLVAEHPAAVVELAESRALEPREPLAVSDMTIDDAETREVDDALSVNRDGEHWRIDVDIADAAAFVETDDVIDREARRRASTAYLPTGTYYMLPDVIGANRASLHAGQPRPVVRTSAWLADDGALVRFEMRRVWTVVKRRLDYDEADELIERAAAEGAPTNGELGDDVGAKLLRLHQLCEALRRQRVARGALTISRREWKIRTSDEGQHVEVTPLELTSPSRELVAEMMITTNGLAAQLAIRSRVPIIFRVQPPPAEALPDIDPDDPVGFARLKGMVPPASLSLHPGQHFGLGLDAYTQITSPLRRYGDLVQQRQLTAHLDGVRPPYDADGLLEVLATVENTESQLKRLENTVNQRWALEYLARLEDRSDLTALVIGAAHKGYRVQIDACGAVTTVVGRRKREVGDTLRVEIEEVKPRRGLLRLRAPD